MLSYSLHSIFHLNKNVLKTSLVVKYYSTNGKTIFLFKEEDIQKIEDKDKEKNNINNPSDKKEDIYLGEIGYFNNNNEFIIEYLIYLDIINLEKLIKEFGIENFIKKIYNDEKIKLGDDFDCYYYNVNNISDERTNNISDEKWTIISEEQLNNNSEEKLNNNSEEKSNDISEEKSNNISEENLELLIIFCQGLKNINQSIQNSNKNDQELYLINKKWLEEFKTIFLFNDIFPLLKLNDNDFNEKDDIQKVIQNISNEIKIKLNDSVKSNLSKLNDKDLFTIEDYNNSDNFFLMVQEVYDKLIDMKIKTKVYH